MKPWHPDGSMTVQSGQPLEQAPLRASRRKLGEQLVGKLHDDFTEHGKAAIQAVRQESPEAYLKIIAGLLPKEIDADVNVRTSPYDYTDAELFAIAFPGKLIDMSPSGS